MERRIKGCDIFCLKVECLVGEGISKIRRNQAQMELIEQILGLGNGFSVECEEKDEGTVDKIGWSVLLSATFQEPKDLVIPLNDHHLTLDWIMVNSQALIPTKVK